MVALSPLEFKLLAYLMERPGQLITRDELLVEVWGYKAGLVTRAVDNTVRRLRKKLSHVSTWELSSVYGGGYLLELGSVGPPLPERLGLFLGREALVDRLMGRIQQPQIRLTLVGPGGTGKTRLALELAWNLPVPPIWVELSNCRTTDQALQAIAKACGVSSSDLDRHLAEFQGVLILDNVEQMVGPIQEMLERWPEPRVLMTSRLHVGAPREQVERVPPLELADALLYYRAIANESGAPSTHDGEEVAELVERLDRLPLAIAVMASMAGSLPANTAKDLPSLLDLQVAAQIGSRYSTLRAAVDWSWGLLDPELQDVVLRLSMFCDGFTTASCAKMLGVSQAQAANHVAQLQSVSMLKVQAGGEVRLYGVVRELAREQRESSAYDYGSAYQSWAVELVQANIDAAPFGPRWREMEPRLADLREALAGCVDPSARLWLTLGLSRWTWRDGNVGQVVTALEKAIQDAAPDGPLDAARHQLAVILLSARRPQEVLDLLSKINAAGNKALQGRCLSVRGAAHRMMGALDLARPDLLLAFELLRDRHLFDCYHTLIRLSMVEEFSSGPSHAEPYLWRAVEVVDELDNPYARIGLATQLGGCLGAQGRLQESIEIMLAALPATREIPFAANGLQLNLGLAYCDLGDYARAEVAYKVGLSSARRLGHRMNHPLFLANLGLLFLLQDRQAEALPWLRRAQAAGQRAGVYAQGSLGILELMRKRPKLAEKQLLLAVVQGTKFEMELTTSLSKCFLALAYLLQDRTSLARETFAQIPPADEDTDAVLHRRVAFLLGLESEWAPTELLCMDFVLLDRVRERYPSLPSP